MKRISSILFFYVVFCEIESGKTRYGQLPGQASRFVSKSSLSVQQPRQQVHGNPSATIMQQALVQQLPNNQPFNGFPYPTQNQQPTTFGNEPPSTSNSIQPPENQQSLQLQQVMHQPFNVYNQPRRISQQNQRLTQQPQILMNHPVNSNQENSVNSNARFSPHLTGLSPIASQPVTPSLNQQALPPTPLNPLGHPPLTIYPPNPVTPQSGSIPQNQQQQPQILLNQPVGFHLRPTPLAIYAPISQQPVPQQSLGYGRVYPMADLKPLTRIVKNDKVYKTIPLPFDNLKIDPKEETTTEKPKRKKEEKVHTEEEESNDNNNDDDNDD